METVTFKKILMDLSMNVYTIVGLRFNDYNTFNKFRYDLCFGKYREFDLRVTMNPRKVLTIYTSQHYDLRLKGGSYMHIENDNFLKDEDCKYGY